MGDWQQIQARIRKARASSDPPGKLAELYEKTRDAMVAFELARLHEKSGPTDAAVRWYTVAAERFRRAQWKTKAQEALARLGAAVPAEQPTAATELSPAPTAHGEEVAAEEAALEAPESAAEAEPAAEPVAEKAGGAEGAPERHRRRRRGRRGGRRRRKQKAQAQAAPAEVTAAPAQVQAAVEPPPRASVEPAPVPEPVTAPAAWQVRGRAGEPALASRMAHLEAQLRRLIASPFHRVDEADQAPAGPGVFVLSDSDQATYYYVEACQTLRVGVGNLLRGERGARPGHSVRSRLAEHLGISESRVSKYLKDHCAVRWLQLDEEASLLAHFAVAVLRPAVNE